MEKSPYSKPVFLLSEVCCLWNDQTNSIVRVLNAAFSGINIPTVSVKEFHFGELSIAERFSGIEVVALGTISYYERIGAASLSNDVAAIETSMFSPQSCVVTNVLTFRLQYTLSNILTSE